MSTIIIIIIIILIITLIIILILITIILLLLLLISSSLLRERILTLYSTGTIPSMSLSYKYNPSNLDKLHNTSGITPLIRFPRKSSSISSSNILIDNGITPLRLLYDNIILFTLPVLALILTPFH